MRCSDSLVEEQGAVLRRAFRLSNPSIAMCHTDRAVGIADMDHQPKVAQALAEQETQSRGPEVCPPSFCVWRPEWEAGRRHRLRRPTPLSLDRKCLVALALSEVGWLLGDGTVHGGPWGVLMGAQHGSLAHHRVCPCLTTSFVHHCLPADAS